MSNLSWNDIRSRALAFSNEWADASRENADAKPFWVSFFNIFGLSSKRVASFEEPVKKLGAKQGFIDLFWKGVLLVEHKSRGKDLDRAYTQALDYFPGISERDLPRYIIVSDFARIRLHDLENGEEHEFPLEALHQNIKLFGFIAGYQTRSFGTQDPVNIKAAELLGRLHDAFEASDYGGHALEVLLVRILFCLFAEDTSIFERQIFQDFIEQRTAEDGSDLGSRLAHLFQILNTPDDKRGKSLDEQLAVFPYVNGKLFGETLLIPDCNRAMREALLDCCALDWSRISPAIFGSLFQSVMDSTERRNLGAHYTTESNILKAIRPLFLDALEAELATCKTTRQLEAFHNQLAATRVFDPACGCGNFLVIAYRELRRLELETLQRLRTHGQLALDTATLIRVDVDQFYGIEIEEFPAQIAQVALWLTDHQMNMRVSEAFGQYFVRLPLKKAPNIVHGNALRLDWASIAPPESLSYIVGNPPFIGKKEQNAEQKAEVMAIFDSIKGAGVLDYVSCWYRKAADYMTAANLPSPAGGATSHLPSPPGRGVGGEGEGEAGAEGKAKSALPANTLAFARELRQKQTDAEQLIWGLLRNRRLKNAKFRRQHPQPPYILDFYCMERKLAIELDGGQHDTQQAYDQARDQWLNKQGIRVLRFWNNQVFQETEVVLQAIWNALPDDENTLTPSPSPGGRGEKIPACGRGGHIRAAFVSTNSITQGEQVGALWPDLLARGIKLHFAHRTFQWTSEARGKAAVHCVIIGFGVQDVSEKWIFEYDTPKAEPHAIRASNINPYLVDAPDVVVTSRSAPLCTVPDMNYGSMPIDDGHLILSRDEAEHIQKTCPQLSAFIRQYLGGDEFINSKLRFCLWLVGANATEIRNCPQVLQRIEQNKRFRTSSGRPQTLAAAATPAIFGEIRQPSTTYLFVPKVSSENRFYMPIGLMNPAIIANGSGLIVPNADLFHLGVLQSTMHMAWLRAVGGRMKSDYQYSIKLVYNNFPWPECTLTPALSQGEREQRERGQTAMREQKQRAAIEAAAQAVLDARALYLPSPANEATPNLPSPTSEAASSLPSPSGRGAGGEGEAGSEDAGKSRTKSATLADLYDPLTMPPELVKAHQALDKAVDAAYGVRSFESEAKRVAFLFERYQQLAAPLVASAEKPAKKRSKLPAED